MEGQVAELVAELVVPAIVVVGELDVVVVALVGKKDQGRLIADRPASNLAKAEEVRLEGQGLLQILHPDHGVSELHEVSIRVP